MDIPTALATAKTLIDVLKGVRDIEQGVEKAEFRAKIGGLIEQATDLRIALSEAKDALLEKDREITRLKDLLAAATKGEVCPKCRSGRMRVVDEKPDPIFRVHGISLQTLACDEPSCGLTRQKQFDPNNPR